MRYGDVYFWSYKDPDAHGGTQSFGAYHCKSQIAIVQSDGRLMDTFWSSMADRSLVDTDKVNITLQGNVEDMSTISPHEIHYYDRPDVVDTRHPNNSSAPVYLKPGAARSAGAMLERLNSKIESAQSDIRVATSNLERYRAMMAKVESGQLDDVYL